jgi:glycosyltransferase involved in cell wall biosynthesis
MGPPLRVALLSSYPPDHAAFSGGVQSATAALLEGFRTLDDDVDVHVVAAGSEPHHVRERVEGIAFHFLPAVPGSLRRPRFAYRAVTAARELRRVRPAIVHCQDSILLAPAASAGRWPKVFTVHGIKRAEARSRTGWERSAARFEALLERSVRGRFDALICNSDYASREAGAGGRVFRIPNAVRARFFDLRRRAEQDAPLLLFVGALTPLKRPEDLVEVHRALLPELPRLQTVFCGEVEDAVYARALRAAVERDGIPGVVWQGLARRDRLEELLERATALVLPSVQENVPMVIAEAMAAGVPVVASDVGGVAEMVDHGRTGFLYRPGDVVELERHLRTLLRDPAAAGRMGAAGRERARQAHLPAAVARSTLDAYRTLIAARNED